MRSGRQWFCDLENQPRSSPPKAAFQFREEACIRSQFDCVKLTGLLTTRVRVSAVAVCLVLYVGTLSSVWGGLPQHVSDNNSQQVSREPVITAKPERVTLTNGSGSTEIDWDTGNGSMGFVFVTAEGGKAGLFASGPRGTQMAPWIGKHSYVFELYGDNQRQTLLARVTVSGSAESSSSQQATSWQVVARWPLIIGLAAVLYFAVYLSSTGPVRTTFPTEPTSSPRRLHVVGSKIYRSDSDFHCS